MKKIKKSLFFIISAVLISFSLFYFGCGNDTVIQNSSIPLDLLYNYTDEGEITSLTELGKQQIEIEIPTKINDTYITSIDYLGGSTTKKLIIGNHIKHIEAGALRDNLGLESLTIPFVGESAESGIVRSISYLFSNNTTPIPKTLKNLIITGGTRIHQINNCDRLEYLYLPETLNSIGSIQSCTNLKRIIIATGNPVYDSRNDCDAIIETNSNKLIVGCMNTSIPSDIEIIGNRAFYNTSLKSINIPNSVIEIELEAFLGVRNIENSTLFIPKSVKKIGRGAFYLTTGIKRVVFEETNGWFQGYKAITPEQLSDPELACELLTRDTNYSWVNTL